MKRKGRGIVWLAVLSVGWFGQAWGWWDPDMPLVRSNEICYFSFPTQWAIAADNQGGVHVVWYDTRDGWASEAYYKRSTDGGITWDADVPLTAGSQYWQEVPAVACDSRGRVGDYFLDYGRKGRCLSDLPQRSRSRSLLL